MGSNEVGKTVRRADDREANGKQREVMLFKLQFPTKDGKNHPFGEEAWKQ
ncbi:MAG: hypothetical protein KME27_26845 [Lyngbya sp. HA4199-MV5]|nr:hypothetical protein [Lyngbya sp. HA4199-MV5]